MQGAVRDEGLLLQFSLGRRAACAPAILCPWRTKRHGEVSSRCRARSSAWCMSSSGCLHTPTVGTAGTPRSRRASPRRYPVPPYPPGLLRPATTGIRGRGTAAAGELRARLLASRMTMTTSGRPRTRASDLVLGRGSQGVGTGSTPIRHPARSCPGSVDGHGIVGGHHSHAGYAVEDDRLPTLGLPARANTYSALSRILSSCSRFGPSGRHPCVASRLARPLPGVDPRTPPAPQRTAYRRS